MDEKRLNHEDPDLLGYTNQLYSVHASNKNLIDSLSEEVRSSSDETCRRSRHCDNNPDDVISELSSGRRLTCNSNIDIKRQRLSATSDTRKLMASSHDEHIVRGSDISRSKLRQRSVSRDYDDDLQINAKVSDHGSISPTAVVLDETKILNVQFTTKPKITKDDKDVREKDSNPNEPKFYTSKLSNGRELNRTKSQIERMKVLRIPRDSSFRTLARQISRKAKSVDVADDIDDVDGGGTGGRRPRTFFDLAIVTMCCCVSPLGLVAVVMAVLSDANHKSGHRDKAVRYGRLALILSILGMVTSVALAITLLLIFRYPWKELQQP